MMLEEKQIIDFVHRVSHDEVLYEELISNQDSVIAREKFLPPVAEVIRKLVPHLSMIQNEAGEPKVLLDFWQLPTP